jgi:hypothetical protein
MGPRSRVRLAKCQMLGTGFFVLVTGRRGGVGRWARMGVVGHAQAFSTVVTPPHTHQPYCPNLFCRIVLGSSVATSNRRWTFGQDAPMGSSSPPKGQCRA